MAKQKGSRATPEFYLAFHIGLKPVDLIKKGKNMAMVYYYFRKYNNIVKPAFELLIKEQPNKSNGIDK